LLSEFNIDEDVLDKRANICKTCLTTKELSSDLVLNGIVLSAFSPASGQCSAGEVKDWAGICFNKSETKACPACAPGSAAAAEKPNTSPPEEKITKTQPAGGGGLMSLVVHGSQDVYLTHENKLQSEENKLQSEENKTKWV
jgi:hypothetical protein